MPPKVLTFPAGPQTCPGQATQLWGAEQDSGRAGLIRSLSGRDGRLIAILSEPAHNCVCVCVCGCARLRVPVLREVGLGLEGGHGARGWVAQVLSPSSEACLVWCAPKRST